MRIAERAQHEPTRARLLRHQRLAAIDSKRNTAIGPAAQSLTQANSRQSTGLCAKRRIILLSMGSCTVSAASLAESHRTSRCSFSGHCLLCRVTFSGNTRTSQTTRPPFLRRFSYRNDPTERLPIAPTTPASSKASRAAVGCFPLLWPALRDDPASCVP